MNKQSININQKARFISSQKSYIQAIIVLMRVCTLLCSDLYIIFNQTCMLY